MCSTIYHSIWAIALCSCSTKIVSQWYFILLLKILKVLVLPCSRYIQLYLQKIVNAGTSLTRSQNAVEFTTNNSGSEDTEVLRQTGLTAFAVLRFAAPPSSHLGGGGRIFFFKCFVCKFNEECFTGAWMGILNSLWIQPRCQSN